MSSSFLAPCLPFPWVLEIAQTTFFTSIVVRDAPELKRCLLTPGLTELRLVALANADEDRHTVIARADATCRELLQVAHDQEMEHDNSYLDVRLGHFDLVIRLRE